MSTAYGTNPTLRAAEAELRSVNENVPQALSNWRPSLDFTGNARVGTTENTGANRFEEEADWSAALNLTQPLFRGGRTLAQTRQAKAQVYAQRARLLDTEQGVLLTAATAFLDVWRDQAILGLNQSNENVLREQLEATEVRLEVGEVTRTDLSQAQSRLARAKSGRVAADGNLGQSRAAYKEVVGDLPGTVEDPPRVLTLPQTQEEAVTIALEENLGLVASRFDETAERQNVRIQFGNLLPEVNIIGQLSHSESTNNGIRTRNDARGIAQVTMPLYEQGLVSSQIRQAKQVANQRRLQVEEARRDAEQTAVDAWEALVAARAQIEAFETEVEATRIALDGVRAENSAGARTVLDILDAEQEFLDAQVNLVSARRDEIVASYQLLTTLGRMTASFLALDAEVYDPEVDYDDVSGQIYGFGELPYLSDW